MKKYIVKWKTIKEDVITGSVLNSGLVEILAKHTFDDIQFKNNYIKATDDSSGFKLRIPYTSVYDIEDIDSDASSIELEDEIASYIT